MDKELYVMESSMAKELLKDNRGTSMYHIGVIGKDDEVQTCSLYPDDDNNYYYCDNNNNYYFETVSVEKSNSLSNDKSYYVMYIKSIDVPFDSGCDMTFAVLYICLDVEASKEQVVKLLSQM